MTDAATHLRYKRAKFSTRLSTERLYTAGHQWMKSEGDDLWRVGFTKFALRMLGDPVELEFEAALGQAIDKGDVVGWVEGFKAVTDVFAPLSGTFAGTNPELARDITLLGDPGQERGWLFALRGTPDEECVDAQGYASHLDATIDRMLGTSP